MDGLFGEDDLEEITSEEEKEAQAKRQSERAIETQAQEIFRPWVSAWYEGRYTQDKGQIVKVIKDALRNKVPVDGIVLAMNYIGHQGQVVSNMSLQFALNQAMNHYKNMGAGRRSTTAGEDPNRYTEGI